MSNKDVVVLVISLISLVISIKAYLNSRHVCIDLEKKYWTKEVVGRTINSKTGSDSIANSKKQDIALRNNVIAEQINLIKNENK